MTRERPMEPTRSHGVPPVREPRAGMTIVELLIALTIFGVVISVALSAMARENAAYQEGLDRMSAVRNIRFAMANLEMDLQTLGTNVPDLQPELVYAGPDVVAFTADHTTNVVLDPFAVYRDPDAPFGEVTLPSSSVSIPGTMVAFPQISYNLQAGIPSPAEMIIFFLRPDTTTADPDDHILWRQVNGAGPQRVAGGLRRSGTEPFFSYIRLAKDNTGATNLEPVADSLLPLHHFATEHLSQADTGRSAVADSVRGVRVTFAATGGRTTGGGIREVPLSRLIALPNAGFGTRNTCGAPPILGVGLLATVVVQPSGDPVVVLNWTAATDEAMGEQDVVRYVLWRRPFGSADWGDPYVAIPGGGSPYTYEDADVTPGAMYEYALAAQDCTPRLSPVTASNPVVIP